MKIIEKLKKVWYYLIAREKELEKKIGKRERKDREDDVMKAITLSNHIIKKFDEQNAPITNLKLQKVLYYVQGYSLRIFGEPAFREEICNWHYGPVVPMVYYEFNGYGAHPLSPQDTALDLLDEKMEQLVSKIVEKCKCLRPSELVTKTHAEDPWKDTVEGEVISQLSMRRYFSRNNPLSITV